MAASTYRVLQSAQMEVNAFIRSKGTFVSFFKRKICRETIRKIKEYTHKKETIDLRTTPTFLSVIIYENTT